MAEALRPGGLYQVGDEWRDANGEKADAPTSKEKKQPQTSAQDEGAGANDEAWPEGFPDAELYRNAGYESAEEVQAASDEDLLGIDGVGQKRLEKMRAFNL